MKIFAAYLLVSVALASGISEDASLRGASDDLADVNVERGLKNACENSDVKWNTYSGKTCFSKCACNACKERGGGVCCAAGCNPQVSEVLKSWELGVAAIQAFAIFHFLTSRSSLLYLLILLRRRQCDPKNPPCDDSQVHKWCHDEDLCNKCKKKGLCCTDVCDFYHCDKNLPPCSGPCFDNIDNCQELVQCPLGCGTGCAQEATVGCHKCCRDKHPALGASCEVDVRQSCKVRIAAFLLDYDCAVVNDTSLSLTPPNHHFNFHSIFAHSSARMQPGLPQSPLLLLGPSKLPYCSGHVSNISNGFQQINNMKGSRSFGVRLL